MKNITHITGNANKAKHMAKFLGVPLEHKKLDLVEVQAVSSKDVIEHKVRQAYELVKTPVIVDDVALHIHALGGLPGALVKYFVEDAGLETMCRMLDGFSDRSATGTATLAYYDGSTLRIFEGRIDGVIATHPRGEAGYGWDSVFEPEGYGGRTRAELSEAEYERVYRTIRPLDELKTFLLS